jgi:CHAD domain-containing protein
MKPMPENVHGFRTSSRRVEALLSELLPDPGRNERRLLKLLARLRKKAGRVRDLDVQVATLRTLRIPQESGQKTQLMRTLLGERTAREKKLGRAFDKDTVREARRRLKRAARDLNIPKDTEPLSVALRRMARLSSDHAPLTEQTLHRYRVEGKRVRYLAELAGKNAEGERIIEELKHMQDVIGDWHDWLRLTQRAEELFGRAQTSALVAALQNVTQSKFQQAVATLSQTRVALSGKRPASRGTRPVISRTIISRTSAAVA